MIGPPPTKILDYTSLKSALIVLLTLVHTISMHICARQTNNWQIFFPRCITYLVSAHFLFVRAPHYKRLVLFQALHYIFFCFKPCIRFFDATNDIKMYQYCIHFFLRLSTSKLNILYTMCIKLLTIVENQSQQDYSTLIRHYWIRSLRQLMHKLT